MSLKKYNRENPLYVTRDHVHPISKGGKNEPHNIVRACVECNVLKGSLLIRDFMARIITLWREERTFRSMTLDLYPIIIQNCLNFICKR